MLELVVGGLLLLDLGIVGLKQSLLVRNMALLLSCVHL